MKINIKWDFSTSEPIRVRLLHRLVNHFAKRLIYEIRAEGFWRLSKSHSRDILSYAPNTSSIETSLSSNHAWLGSARAPKLVLSQNNAF